MGLVLWAGLLLTGAAAALVAAVAAAPAMEPQMAELLVGVAMVLAGTGTGAVAGGRLGVWHERRRWRRCGQSTR